MRSLLFVPGDSERKQARGLESGADALIVDLEDSVASSVKADARQIVRDFVASRQAGWPYLYVRINSLASGMADDDLAAVMPASPDGIVLPKADHADDVAALAVRLRVLEHENGIPEGQTRILPIITETAIGVLNAASHARSDGRVAGLTWGAEDLSAAVGALATRDEKGGYTALFTHARTMTLLAASAAGVPAVDTVYPDFRDADGFARDCRLSARDGFTARMAIHPAQVATINAGFTPSAAEVDRARAVIAAFAGAGDAGVAALDGQMIDRPHLLAAQRLLARAGI